MLYDDSEQIEVRHVISLEHHNVSVYTGEDRDVPDGELWAKRYSIRLSRKPLLRGDVGNSSLPFYFFSENQSDKEDFYFALLKNQEKTPDSDESPPTPLHFDVKNIITLVQRLHSSEEQLQTRWINALVGRLFLGMYKTPQMEAFFRKKISQKISRVKKPNFITKLALQKIDAGEEAPFITNPRLKDLTINGDCTAEADVKYSGNFRIEIAATARIDLGTRFKARDVELVLAVTVKKVEGHGLIRIKPPPSNRVWITFETMPVIDMTVEPIVSSRQITYSIILRTIESRIREVVAESVVLPFWDDIPFMDTTQQSFRGGIWKEEVETPPKSTEIPQEAPEDEAEAGEDTEEPASVHETKEDRTLSMPALPSLPDKPLKSRKSMKSAQAVVENQDNGSSTGVDTKNRSEPPKIMRSRSFASAVGPQMTANSANAHTERRDSLSQKDAASIMKGLNSKSLTGSPVETPVGSPPNEPISTPEIRDNSGSTSSSDSKKEEVTKEHQRQKSNASSIQALSASQERSIPGTPTMVGFGNDSKASSAVDHAKKQGALASVASSLGSAEKRQQSLAAAKNWGWGVLTRERQKGKSKDSTPRPGTPEHPIGRGQPLPPPGVPLPSPMRIKTMTNPVATPKRKAVPPTLPNRSKEAEAKEPAAKPPLPERRQRQSYKTENNDKAEEVMVVQAPPESEPTSPAEEHPEGFVGEMELDEERPSVPEVHNGELVTLVEPPSTEAEPEPLPETSSSEDRSKATSTSSEDRGKTIPTWDTAEEEEARSKSVWTNPQNEY